MQDWPKEIDFIALDVETANEDYASICQIGIVAFNQGKVVGKWGTYVNPQTHFSNTWLHGINEITVKDAPLVPQAIQMLAVYIQDKPVVHHTHYDRSAIQKACIVHDMDNPLTLTLDSARILRRANSAFLTSGYGLENACLHYGICTDGHHDAVLDAEMAGKLVVILMEESGTQILDWVDRLKKRRISERYPERIRKEGAENMPLSGKTVAFTGTLSQPRKDCAEMAAAAGLKVWDRVIAETDYLVVGIPPYTHIREQKLTSKQRMAQKLIDEGGTIEILSEDDFFTLLEDATAL